jgi:hypothetical protein
MLARFERFMEQAVEGGLRRVFPTTLQPVQLAKAAARAMEDAQVSGISGVEVPNSYRLRLAPGDLQRFGEYSSTLSSELVRYLVEYARERGMRPVSEPRVELVEDAKQRVGGVGVDARFVDLAPARKTELDAAVEHTRSLRLADLAGAERDAIASGTASKQGLCLADAAGLRFGLDAAAGIVRLGRATDNDVSIESQRVSRYHAQLRYVGSSWLVYDLDSTNGTFVDERQIMPAQPRALHPGGVLRLGDHEIKVLTDAIEPV